MLLPREQTPLHLRLQTTRAALLARDLLSVPERQPQPDRSGLRRDGHRSGGWTAILLPVRGGRRACAGEGGCGGDETGIDSKTRRRIVVVVVDNFLL